MVKQKSMSFGDGAEVKHGQVSPELVDFAVSNNSDTGIDNKEPSLTRQEFSDECDINVIMANYEKTGVVSHYSPREPVYLDLTVVPNFRDAMDMLIEADKAFMSLPAKVRKEFDNDARKFVEFAQDPANLDKMREYGLAPPKEEPEVAKPPPANVEPSKAEGGAK